MPLVLLLACLTADPAADGSKELERHQGTWAVASFVREGETADPEVVGSIRRVVRGDHVTWEREGKTFAGTRVVLRPDRDPPEIDVIPDGGKDRGKSVLGLYRLDGDTLTICMADADRPRPDAFEAPKGSGRTLMTLRRIVADPGR